MSDARPLGWGVLAPTSQVARLAVLPALAASPPGEAVPFATSPRALVTFLAGLVLIAIGTGFFKPCVSVMVGQLYSADDPRQMIRPGDERRRLAVELHLHLGAPDRAVDVVQGLLQVEEFQPRFRAAGKIGFRRFADRQIEVGSDDLVNVD